MGLLDDAIREHLELKRRRGADAAELSRAESEALGRVSRDPDADPDPAGIAAPPPSDEFAHDAPPHDADADWAGETAILPAAPDEPDYEPPPVPSAYESPIAGADRVPPEVPAAGEPPPVPLAHDTPPSHDPPPPPPERDALYQPPAEREAPAPT